MDYCRRVTNIFFKSIYDEAPIGNYLDPHKRFRSFGGKTLFTF